MEISADPYELKLFQMFQSCDSECCGLLNEEALRRLCGLLELQDKGAVLIEGLSVAGAKPCVSFERFKEALLNFLGTELDGSATTAMTTSSYTSKINAANDSACTKARTLIISADMENYLESPPDSSDREVSPRLVMGSKKYGRRSRPQINGLDEISLTDSENGDTGNEENMHRSCNYNNLVQRSSSQTDIPGSRRRAGTATVNGTKLKRCSSLPAQKNRQNYTKPVVGNKLKALTANNKRTLEDETIKSKQQQQQQSQQQQQHSGSSVESLDTPTLTETLPMQSIIDIWERANIPNGKSILLLLGFDEDEVNLVQLNKILDEELCNLDDEPQTTPLLRASLALQSAELGTLRQTFRQLRDENVKLRSDNKDANQRLAMLAAEIDERHASLEDSSKKEIRLLEQRHASAMRDLTTRLTNDRENWTNLTARLEARLKTFEQEDIKLKSELEIVRQENNDLELEQQKLQKHITDLLEKNIELNNQIADIEDNSIRPEEHRSNSRSNNGKSSSDDEVLRLVEKISTLQVENANLRDKNDELVSEVENLNVELTRTKAKNRKTITMQSSSTITEADDMTLEDVVELGTNGTATKRRGDSPSKTRITEEESPRLGKLRKCANDTCGGSENSDTSGEWMALNTELRNSEANKSIQTTSGLIDKQNDNDDEMLKLNQQITDLEEQLKKLQETDSSSGAEERCKELEASLEQMQRAYEDCEDYWQSKLSEERQIFEKERQIYEDEQEESDKKFTELMEKVREYEEQFSKDGRLSPIEEKDMLEQQYVDLEAEAEELRENARKIFEEKSKEIETLQSEIEDLRLRLGESVEILTGACELSNEAAMRNCVENHHQSPASSPISYLWHQSTIQEPVKNYQQLEHSGIALVPSSPSKQRINLSTSETAIFSTTPMETIGPIQKPNAAPKPVESEAGVADSETSSTTSGKSYETHSIGSTQSGVAQRSLHAQHAAATKTSSSQENNSTSSLGIKEELKRLKFFEISLKEQIKDLSLQRDGLVMELQQLQEARPVLEKAYARTAHPSLIQRVNQLELKNRHLQNVIKQQQQYTETLMQQSWRQHQIELSDLHNRIEAQGSMLGEQVQRLQNADILVKDLYVENSHLAATVQQLEQYRARANMMHQQQRQQGLNGLPGMP